MKTSFFAVTLLGFALLSCASAAPLTAQTLDITNMRVRATATTTLGGGRTLQLDRNAPRSGLIWPDANQNFSAASTIANPIPSTRSQVPPVAERLAVPDGGIAFALTAIAVLDLSGPLPAPSRSTLQYRATLAVPPHGEALVLRPVVSDPGRSPGRISSWSVQVGGVENGMASATRPTTTPRDFSLPPSTSAVDIEIQVNLDVSADLVQPISILTFGMSLTWDTDFTPSAVSIPIAFREIRPLGSSAGRIWDPARALRILAVANHIFGQGSGIQFTLADYRQVVDPGLDFWNRQQVPSNGNWFDIRRGNRADFSPYVAEALADPVRTAYDPTSVNVYLVRSMGSDGQGLPIRGWTDSGSRRFILMRRLPSEDEMGYVLAHELGHAFGLRHNHPEGSLFARCQDCEAHQLDYIRDLAVAHNGKGEALSVSRTTLENAVPSAPYSTLTINDLLRNVMSYYGYFAADVRGLRFSSDQIECMHRTIECYFQSPHQVRSIQQSATSYPGPTRVSLLGTSLPGNAALRVAGQTSPATGTSTRLDADFPVPVQPGRHALDLMSDGRLLETIPEGVVVTPWCDWGFEANGGLQLRVGSTAPNQSAILAMGQPVAGGPVPGVAGDLGLTPTTVVALTTDAQGVVSIPVPAASLPPELFLGLQVVELGPGGSAVLSNRDTVTWR